MKERMNMATTKWTLERAVKPLIASMDLLVAPPGVWFALQKLDGPTPIHVSTDGQIYGHAAAWGVCHSSYQNKCIYVPRSNCNYAKYRTGNVLTAEGNLIPTGRIISDTCHPRTKGLSAEDTKKFYDNTGNAVADVVVYEDEFGLQIAGALRPEVTPAQIRTLRGSSLSGDWRPIRGQLELVALLCVNAPGFIVDGLVASGIYASATVTSLDLVNPGENYAEVEYDESGQHVMALVASAGVSEVMTLTNRLEKLESYVNRQMLRELFPG